MIRKMFFVFSTLVLTGAARLVLAASVDWPYLRFTQVVTNTFSGPISITHAGDGSQRIFIGEQFGRVQVIQSNSVLSQPFLEISNRVLSVGTEQGLLGLTFPAGYSTNAHFYVDYTRQPDGAIVISRFSITSSPNVADPNSEKVILVIPKPYNNHNGGQIAFGPDGYLYIGVGDGGSEGDPDNRGQSSNTLLGKLLRIDVESGISPYAIPPSNPFLDNANYAPEIWDLGLRNPWRFSFDRSTGDLYIGDVGQNQFEEIDFEPAGSPGGKNYGWRIMEGPTNYNVPAGFTNFSALTLPVTWHDHPFLPADFSACVIGGYVYRGPPEPRMDGIYFFGDFQWGWIWGLKQTGTNTQRFELLNRIPAPYSISTFGEDDHGEIYFADYRGKIYQIQETHQVWPPVFTPTNGIANSSNVTLTCATPNAVIHFTTNSIDPTETDPVVPPSGIIPIASGVTNKATAYRPDLAPSPVVTAIFGFRVGTPTFSAPAGRITNNTPITLSTVTPGATIYYSTNSLTPTTNSMLYTGPLTLSGGADGYSVSLKAIGVASGYTNSLIATANYLMAQVSSPIIIPSGRTTVTNDFLVSISCSTPGAVIYYVVDGSLPTTNSAIYSNPFPINGGTTVRAFAVANGYTDSVIQSAEFPLADYKYPSVVTTFAGSSQAGTNNGVSSLARFSSPSGLCIDPAGNLFVADTGNHRIRRITRDGVVSTFAGTGVAGFQNGAAANAQFSKPIGICMDPSGNFYVADSDNSRIRRIDSSGNVTTFAGSGTYGTQDGSPGTAQFRKLSFIDCDSQTNLYAGDWTRIDGTVALVRKIAPDGMVSTLTGTGLGYFDGFATDLGICVDASGLIYALNEWGRFIQITPGGVGTLFAGSSVSGYNDGPRLGALFASYFNDTGRDVATDQQGNFYISDSVLVRKIDSTGWVSTLAGGSLAGLANGIGRNAGFTNVTGVCVDTNGNVYVADTGNNRIRKISPDTAKVGIADDWQLAHFGYIGIDPNADPDNDGVSNFAEFWSGTDPLDGNSAFVIKSVSIGTNSTTHIDWQSVPGKSYRVLTSTNLSIWIPVSVPILATGAISSFTHPAPLGLAAQRYYRVFVEL